MTTSNIFNSNLTIILEGITGSGKSTHAAELTRTLSSGRSVHYFDTSTLYPMLKPLRPTNPDNVRGVLQEALFFQFMNWMRFSNEQRYDVAIVDRFLLSNCVYTLEKMQRLGISHDPAKVRETTLNPFGFDPLEGTVTLYLDCPVGAAQERVSRRERSVFDSTKETNAQRIYEQELKTYAHEAIVIDGSKEQSAVQLEIVRSLDAVIKR